MLRSFHSEKEPNCQIVSASEGVMQALLDHSTKTPTFTLKSLITSDGSGSLTIENGFPRIRLATTQGNLVLTTQGYSLNSSKLIKYTASEYKKLGLLIKSDKTLHSAALNLRKAATQTVYSFAALHGAAPSKQFADALLKSNKQQAAFGKKPANHTCRVERVVDTITREVEGWVTTVLTAAEQGAQCEESCVNQFFPFQPLEFLGCTAGCAAGLFEDIVTSSWEVLETITEEVVTEIIHCTVDQKLFPSPWGAITVPKGLVSSILPQASVDPKVLAKSLGVFGDMLTCLVKGKWSLTPLSELKVTISGVSSIPLGVTVCMDRACTDKFSIVTAGIGLVQAAASLLTALSAEGMPAIIAALGLQTIVDGIALALGMTVAEIIAILSGAVIILAEHAAIIAGQIVVWDAFGMAPNGVCLTYPALPGVVAGIINPVVGLVVLGNTPIIVTPR